MLFFFWPVAKEAVSSSSEPESNDELEQITIARALINYRRKEKIAMANPNAPIPFRKKFSFQNLRPTSPQPPLATTSKILPLICQKMASRGRTLSTSVNDRLATSRHPSPAESSGVCHLKFPAAGATPYVPFLQLRTPCRGMAPPVTIRTSVPVFSAPPLMPPAAVPRQLIHPAPVRVAPPVTIRQTIPVFATPPIQKEEPPTVHKEDLTTASVTAPNLQSKLVTASSANLQSEPLAETEESGSESSKICIKSDAETVKNLEELKL